MVKWLGRLVRFRALSVVVIAALLALWVRSSDHIDLLVIPVPMGSCGVVGTEYGVITWGWKSERNDDVSAGFHSVNSNDDDNDPEAQLDPATFAASVGATPTKSDRHWLAHGLIQYMVLSGDNEPREELSFAGFAVVTASEPCANGSLSIPLWFLLALVGLAALWRKWRALRLARLAREHRCPVCRYDLRAAPERCPECGTQVVRPHFN